MKYSRIFSLLSLIIALSVLIISCGDDDDIAPVQKTVEENGLTKDINDLIPTEILNEMVGLGMPINGGGLPPALDGIYLATKFILDTSNIAEDFIGFKYPDFKVQFTGFNPYSLSVQMNYVNGFESGSGLEAFIVGSENDFSVFAEVISEKELEETSFAYVVSGSIVNDTIRDLYVANFMLDNKGNPTSIWIENGQGRILRDKDGNSEPIESL